MKANYSWSKAMRAAKGRDGEACKLCGAPSHNVLMVGSPTPGGLEFEGDVALCDECVEKVLTGDSPATELIS